MNVQIGPLPLIETGTVTIIALLPGEVPASPSRTGRVSRDRNQLRIRMPGVTLLFDLRAERALRAATRLLLVESEAGQARPLGDLTLIWDL